MNEQSSPNKPERIPPPISPSSNSDPAEFEKMNSAPGVFSVAEVLLKKPGQIAYEIERGNPWRMFRILMAIALVSFLVFGLTVGMFSWGQQLWITPLKVTGGVMFSALICFPSLFIFACLSGIDISVRSCLVMLTGLLAISGLLLLGFAPVSWVFSQSTEGVVFIGWMNLVFWFLALWCGVRFMQKSVQCSHGRRMAYMSGWVVIFILVTLQMTSTLRPIIGSSDQVFTSEKKFFIDHWGDCMSGKVDPESKLTQ